MSSQPTQQPPKVLRFLNDYRKQLALLKTKSFYANHLCKISCLQGKLDQNREQCINECDSWLDRFYKTKKQKNPDQDALILLSSTEVPLEQRMEYEKACANTKMMIKNYVGLLDTILNEKIQQCSAKKK